MFVSKVDIQEFKGIKKCDKPLGLSDFVILIGRNNSGKSSVLEALSLLPLPYDFLLPYCDKTRVQLLSDLHGGKSSMVYAYSGIASIKCRIQPKKGMHGRNWEIELDGRGSANLYVSGLDRQTILTDPIRAMSGVLRLKASKKEISRIVNTRVFFIPNDTSFLDRMFQTMGHETNRYLVMKTGAHTRVARNIINECVDDKYTEILFAPELSARKELPDNNVLYIKIKDLGDGIEKVALLVLWLEALNPALVLWDDFEGSAHPTLVKLLLKWLCKKKWQVILSTHSIDVLSSLLDVKPKNAKVIQLRKTMGDVLVHQDLSLEELETLIEANQDPRILVDLLRL